MAQLGTVLEKLFTNAGVDTSGPEIIKLLQNGEVYKAEVPDNISTAFESLITLESAKHNPTLKSHFKAQALNGVDATLKNLIEELGDEDLKNEILGIQGTEKKIPALLKSVQALEAKKANAKPNDKAPLQAEIDRLNGQINEVKTQFATKEQELVNSFNGKLLKNAIKSQLAGYNYTDALPKHVTMTTAMQLLEQEAAKKKVKFVPLDEDFSDILLKQADNPEMDYFENNKKISYGDFVSSILANNKLLKVANSQQQSGNNNSQQAALPIVNNEALSIYAQQQAILEGAK